MSTWLARDALPDSEADILSWLEGLSNRIQVDAGPSVDQLGAARVPSSSPPLPPSSSSAAASSRPAKAPSSSSSTQPRAPTAAKTAVPGARMDVMGDARKVLEEYKR
jgi:hypothetical protein